MAKDAHAHEAAEFARRVDRQKEINGYSISNNGFAFDVFERNVRHKGASIESGDKAKLVVRFLEGAENALSRTPSDPQLATDCRRHALKHCPGGDPSANNGQKR